MRDLELEQLVELALRLAPDEDAEGAYVSEPMPGLALLRRHDRSVFEAYLYEPVLCLILQGRKEVSIGQRSLSFGVGECLLVSHDLPVRSRITKAPYLALVFAVELATVRRLYDEVDPALLDDERARTADTQRADRALLDVLRRYLALAESPIDAKVLAPLVSRELHYRLLTAPFGGMLRRLLRHDSNASAIGRAIALIRDDIRAPIVVPELARRVGMSASSFHKHFKSVTETTPLQYHKELRLIEAQRRLRAGGASVTAVALDVGYASLSQFSREFARKFGVSPGATIPQG